MAELTVRLARKGASGKIRAHGPYVKKGSRFMALALVHCAEELVRGRKPWTHGIIYENGRRQQFLHLVPTRKDFVTANSIIEARIRVAQDLRDHRDEVRLDDVRGFTLLAWAKLRGIALDRSATEEAEKIHVSATLDSSI
jgi:hypothetical protein